MASFGNVSAALREIVRVAKDAPLHPWTGPKGPVNDMRARSENMTEARLDVRSIQENFLHAREMREPVGEVPHDGGTEDRHPNR